MVLRYSFFSIFLINYFYKKYAHDNFPMPELFLVCELLLCFRMQYRQFKLWIYSFVLQVGQWACEDRLNFLEDKYSFRCQCIGCSQLNLSDLVLKAFHCVDPSCDGVVLDHCVDNSELNKLKNFPGVPRMQVLDPFLKVVFLLCNRILVLASGVL